MTIKDHYQQLLASGNLVEDPAQGRVVERLDDLQRRLLEQAGWSSRIRRWLSAGEQVAFTKGIYLWGGVGRGKTLLMDLFFSSLPGETKRRIHFHRMMSGVHRRLRQIENCEDPLDMVADDIARESSVLCFDEFFISDIGDAMILGRLLDGLFQRGVTLVATSNSSPRDLYRDGLQRQKFIPAIEALETFTEVVEIGGEVDYRLRLFQEAGTYLAPPGAEADRKLEHYFEEIATGDRQENAELSVLGRPILARRCAKGIAWFEFEELCEGPRSQEDYIEIARWYPTVIVSNVPTLDRERENAARRFIALVDEFYDRRVKLLLSASAAAGELYQGERLGFEFDRTASRLVEMQTEEYLHAPHLA